MNNTNSSTTEHTGPDVYFYSNIDAASVKELHISLATAAQEAQGVGGAYNLGVVPAIKLHISSFGGSLVHGFAAADFIQRSPAPVITIVEGVTASAATLLSLSGHRRLITPNSTMLIHQLTAAAWGKYSDLKEELDNLTKMMNLLEAFYLKRTKLTKKVLKDLLKRDVVFTAKECIKAGLADFILG